jgi:hypothetical protein
MLKKMEMLATIARLLSYSMSSLGPCEFYLLFINCREQTLDVRVHTIHTTHTLK